MKKMLFVGLLIGTIFSLNAKSFNVRFCNVTPEVKDKDESTKIIFSGADIYYKVIRNGKVLKASKKNAAEGKDESLFYKKEEKLGPGVQRNLDSPNQIAGVGLPGTKDSDEVYITKIIVKGLKISNDSKEEVATKWDRRKPVKMKHDDVFYVEPYGPELTTVEETPTSNLHGPELDTVEASEDNLPTGLSVAAGGTDVNITPVEGAVTVTDQEVDEEVIVQETAQTPVATSIDSDIPNRVGTGYRLRLGCFYTSK